MDYAKELKHAKKKPLIDLEAPSFSSLSYGRDVIEKILPNRDPFLFLDRITGIDLEQGGICGTRVIDPQDPVFKGHFPDFPVYPGVLQLEMISELFCCLFYFLNQGSMEVPHSTVPVQLRAIRMQDALLQEGLFPGDEATIITRELERDDFTFKGIGQIMKDNKVAVAVIGEFYILE